MTMLDRMRRRLRARLIGAAMHGNSSDSPSRALAALALLPATVGPGAPL